VEVWHRAHLAAVFDRAVLSDWLREPSDDLVVDEARLYRRVTADRPETSR
jgi:hypothetical protein